MVVYSVIHFSGSSKEFGGIRKSPWQSTEDGHQPIHEELHV